MHISFIFTSMLLLACTLGYFAYAQYRRHKNRLLFNLSKRIDCIRTSVEPTKNTLVEENIIEEITTPILSSIRKKTSQKNPEKRLLKNNPQFLSIYIMATPNVLFRGYDLLQAISVNGFHYGKMQIFHYHENTSDINSPILFSLANALEPGFFNLTEMGAFSCPGLILFMELNQEGDLFNRFYSMIEIAKQLADDLGGEILDDSRKPFDAISQKHYLEKLEKIKAAL